MNRNSRLPIWFALLPLALLMGTVCRAYYAFVFLPNLHDGWRSAATHTVDAPGWWAFVTSPLGVVLNLLWFVPLVAFVVLLVWPRESA